MHVNEPLTKKFCVDGMRTQPLQTQLVFFTIFINSGNGRTQICSGRDCAACWYFEQRLNLWTRLFCCILILASNEQVQNMQRQYIPHNLRKNVELVAVGRWRTLSVLRAFQIQDFAGAHSMFSSVQSPTYWLSRGTWVTIQQRSSAGCFCVRSSWAVPVLARDVHSLTVSIQHFLCLPQCHPPSKVPHRMSKVCVPSASHSL